MTKLIPNNLLILVFAFLLGGCVGFAPRPSAVPWSAEFSGGIAGGAWLKCEGLGENLICKIYNYNGELYETGEFVPVKQLSKCYPNFILTDYRYHRQFLLPKLIHQPARNYHMAMAENGELRNAIAHATNTSDISIIEENQCHDGYYSATDADGKKSSGHIWAGKFFEYWQK